MSSLSGRYLSLCALLAAPCSTAAAQERFFPDTRSFEYPLASPLAAGFAGRLIQESIGDDQFGDEREADVILGENFPVIALRQGPRPVTLGFAVHATGRFSLDDSKTALISNDWQVGFNVLFDHDPVELDIQLYHESSHLGDEYIKRFAAKRIDWTREVVAVWLGYRWGKVKVMGSVGNAVVDELDLPPWLAALGIDLNGGAFSLLGLRVRPLAGLYAEANEATDWRVTSRARLGLAFPGGRVGRELRLSLVGHDGLSTQRQFFRSSSRYFGIEIEFQL